MKGIYARVSDDKKKDDGERRQDVDRQINYLLDFFSLEREGLRLYIDDGKSAFTDDINQRPEFRRLMMDVRRNYIKEIYIEDMTRFARNLSLGLQWLKEFGQYGATIKSAKEGELEVTSSRGWMASTMLLMFAEWDSRVKSEKVKNGMEKARNLKKNIGRPKKKGGLKSEGSLNVTKDTSEG